MKREPRIEVLLAAYNGERYIGQQLDSILDQTVPPAVITVSDDASEDRTREILAEYQRRYPERIRVKNRDKTGRFADRPGRVPPAAMNFFWLLSQADADYVLLSDQDDVWKPEKIGKLLKSIRREEETAAEKAVAHAAAAGAAGAQAEKAVPGTAEKAVTPVLAYSDMEVADRQLRQISPSFARYSGCDPRRRTLGQILVENPVTGGAAMMNRGLLELVRTVPPACCMHDWWIALCAACFGTILWVDEPLSLYRQHGENVMGARKAGSIGEMRKRLGQGAQVRANYERMFAQAAAFEKVYGDRLSDEQKAVISAYLALKLQSPAGRARNIIHNRFYKSSLIQTAAQCFTIGRDLS